jgi:FSR family fosmidomycin resistance protein-like MFS transporter
VERGYLVPAPTPRHGASSEAPGGFVGRRPAAARRPFRCNPADPDLFQVFLSGEHHELYSFYLIEKFHLSVQSAQLYLFVFLLAAALGTLFGGPIGDRVGRKRVIWISILGVAPFSMLLPYVDLLWTGILSFVIGLILASAFSAILVFAQELMPGKVGAVSGLFFGFAFGMGGIGAAVLGALADLHGIEFVYRLCAFLPLLGMVAAFLPDMRRPLTAGTP